jgi:hypothetical protein
MQFTMLAEQMLPAQNGGREIPDSQRPFLYSPIDSVFLPSTGQRAVA